MGSSVSKVKPVVEKVEIPPTTITLYYDDDLQYPIGSVISLEDVPNALRFKSIVNQRLRCYHSSIKMTIYVNGVQCDHLGWKDGDDIKVVPIIGYNVNKKIIYLHPEPYVMDFFEAIDEKFGITALKVACLRSGMKEAYLYRQMENQKLTSTYFDFMVEEFEFDAQPIENGNIEVSGIDGSLNVNLENMVGDPICDDGKVIFRMNDGKTYALSYGSDLVAERQANIIKDYMQKYMQDTEYLGRKLLQLHQRGLPYQIGLEIIRITHSKKDDTGNS